MESGKIYQINIKERREGSRGLPKQSVDACIVTFKGLQGDFNVYRHEILSDDPDSAILLMPLETIVELNREGWPINAGDIGENITSLGVPYDKFSPGKKLSVGDAQVQISRACDPCKYLYLLPYVGDEKGPAFVKTMIGRRGWYARVIKEGSIKKGDRISIME